MQDLVVIVPQDFRDGINPLNRSRNLEIWSALIVGPEIHGCDQISWWIHRIRTGIIPSSCMVVINSDCSSYLCLWLTWLLGPKDEFSMLIGQVTQGCDYHHYKSRYLWSWSRLVLVDRPLVVINWSWVGIKTDPESLGFDHNDYLPLLTSILWYIPLYNILYMC